MRGQPENELGVTMCFEQVDNRFLFQNEGKDSTICFTINKLESSDNEASFLFITRYKEAKDAKFHLRSTEGTGE